MNLCCVSDDDDEVRAFQLKWHSDSVREEKKEQWDGRKKSLFSRCRTACCEVWVRRGKNRYKTAEVKNNSEISKEVFVWHIFESFSPYRKSCSRVLPFFGSRLSWRGTSCSEKKVRKKNTNFIDFWSCTSGCGGVLLYVSKTSLWIMLLLTMFVAFVFRQE